MEKGCLGWEAVEESWFMTDSSTVRQILTHPGGAHKDDFLACCVLIHKHGLPVVRREPEQADLDDLGTIVVDVGGEHAPDRNNFDHHQFPRESEPLCALSLVLKDLGIYEDARQFCDWLEVAEQMDCRGPMETAVWLGIDRGAMGRLMSPVDVTMIRRFASYRELKPEDALWQVMGMIGEDLVEYVTSLRARLDFVAEKAEFWSFGEGESAWEALFMPRTDPMPEETSAGLGRFVEMEGGSEKVLALVYPDRRGTGYGLSRFQDSKRMEFTRIGEEADVHFAHARGFVAKTSASEVERLKMLLEQAFVG